MELLVEFGIAGTLGRTAVTDPGTRIARAALQLDSCLKGDVERLVVKISRVAEGGDTGFLEGVAANAVKKHLRVLAVFAVCSRALHAGAEILSIGEYLLCFSLVADFLVALLFLVALQFGVAFGLLDLRDLRDLLSQSRKRSMK